MNIASSFKNARDVKIMKSNIISHDMSNIKRMNEELNRGNYKTNIRADISKDQKKTRKEIRQTVRGLMAMNNKGIETFTNHATAEEERFIKYYTAKRIRSKDKHDINQNDNGLRNRVEEFTEESIKSIKEDLMNESFRDAIYSFHTTLQKL